MLWLEIVIAVGVAIILGNVVARKSRLASPLALLAMGLLLTLLPDVRGVGLPAEVILILFLPVLLFAETWSISERELRRSLRGILLNGTFMVVFTAATIAVVAHLLGLSWGTAMIIGAALAPTDATAVSALGGKLPYRHQEVLKAESLINDGTALVVFALGLEVARGEGALTFGHVSALFGLSFAGAILVGGVLGWLTPRIGKLIPDALSLNLFHLLLPFLAYFLAEEIHGSGVLAVVVCGLLFKRQNVHFVSVETRTIAGPFWGLLTYILNGTLFVLVGLQVPAALSGIGEAGIWQSLGVILAVFLASVLGRFVAVHLEIWGIRLADRRPQQRLRRTNARQRLVTTMAGLRGGVSLAMALSVPELLGGRPFPGRDMIVLVTAGVVLLSLVVQGLLLGPVVRWAGLEENTEEEERETALAWKEAGLAAGEAAEGTAAALGVDPEILAVMREEGQRAHTKYGGAEGESAEIADRWEQAKRLQVALLDVKRRKVVQLRNEQRIDARVAHDVLARLDQEEMRLTGPLVFE